MSYEFALPFNHVCRFPPILWRAGGQTRNKTLKRNAQRYINHNQTTSQITKHNDPLSPIATCSTVAPRLSTPTHCISTMSATTIIFEAFGPDANLYTAVLQLPSDESESVTPSQLRKAYYRQALKYHPDKQNGKSSEEVNDAKRKFQAISVAYSILSDDDRRKTYDESGEMDDSDEGLDPSNTDAWKDYFKGIFGKVTTADIDKFTESYKCSEEEEADVLKYYTQFKGDLDKMLECVMCSNDIDKKRWVKDYIQPAIEKRDVEDYVEQIKKTLGDDDSEDSDSDEKEGPGGDDSSTDTETEEEEEGVNGNGGKKGKKRKTATATKPKGTTRKAATKPKKKQKSKKNDNAISEDLIAAIRGKSGGQGFGGVLAGLEERYATKGKLKKGGRKQAPVDDDIPDIPDDEFEKIQKRLDAQRKRKK